LSVLEFVRQNKYDEFPMRLAEQVASAGRAAAHYGLLRSLVRESFSPSYFETIRASHGEPAVLKDSLDIVARIDRKGLSEIFEQYKNTDPAPGFSKYLDAPTHVARAVRHARALGLHASPPRRILDIGSGAGYFPFVCRYYGHQATAMDIGTNEMYVRLRALLDVPCIRHRIEAVQALPSDGAKYDWVTGFQILFDRRPDRTPWSRQEWAFFLGDLGLHLAAESRIFLDLNTFKPEDADVLRDNLQYFREQGAEVDGRQVLLSGSKRRAI
jgi:hypothetical protein